VEVLEESWPWHLDALLPGVRPLRLREVGSGPSPFLRSGPIRCCWSGLESTGSKIGGRLFLLASSHQSRAIQIGVPLGLEGPHQPVETG
jgi:hypothetical protein